MLNVRYISVCGVCGGPRHSSGGSACKKCYLTPDIREKYLKGRASARQPLPFSTYRIDFAIPKPRKPVIRKPKVFWAGDTVPVNNYIKPSYPRSHNRIETIEDWHATDRVREALAIIRAIKIPRVQKIRTPVERRVALSYPFLAKPRDEHADLLAVNAMIPQMPGREDICQEIMLALWENKITIEQIKANRANLRPFITAFSKENYEARGYAISLDMPMHDGRSWHDVLADSGPLPGDEGEATPLHSI